ncbi:MAG: RND transporter [Bacteroidetes bacterium CG18_big_fil_WC_8_21_14_2_50_41_14]|nr:MAG: RND transporter [Bacteroidetes bacterium CG18_big_fil_WC_8_21_14_2_50_41_14]PJB59881.1 MAG: RND transporter [Bacteroidetes bacterium CG_4_9_14_3_um_filter_41_19]
MKKIIAYFIKYPVSANVFIVAFALFGTIALFNLRSSFFPLAESKIINIQVVYPGASPQEVEEGIVLKIEDNLRGITGVERFTSVSSENSAIITVEVEKDYRTETALEDVKNAVNRINSFPIDMEPPVIFKNENLNPTVTFAISGKNMSLRSLKETARKIEDDLRSIDGISKVDLSGFPDEEIEVAVNELALRTYQLTFDQVANAIKKANIDITGGKIKTDTEEYLIRGRFKEYFGQGLENIIVKSDVDGKTIRLADVAVISDRWSENPNRIELDNEPTIEVNVQTTNSEDFLEAAEKVNKYIASYNSKNDGVKLTIVNDRSINLLERRDLLLRNGAFGMVLVLLLLSLFLNPRMAFWVATGIPISFLGMFVLAQIFGVTINVISLFGMIVVIGILVDDGIVIAENIYYQYEKGKNPIRAAIDGTMEVLPAIFSAVLTTILAFAIFYFLDGRVGDFFTELAFVVIATLGISLVEAVIILPAHLAHSRALRGKKASNWVSRFMDKIMIWMRDTTYAPTLRFVIKNKVLTFAIALVFLALTIAAFKGGIIKGTFFPFIERDNIAITLKMPQGTNESISNAWIDKIEEAAWRVNEQYKGNRADGLDIINHISKKIGPSTSDASLNIILLKGEVRNVVSYEIANAIAKETGPVIGAESLSYGGGGSFGKPISVAFLGNNLEELELAKDELKAELTKLAALKDVNDNDLLGIKEINVQLKPKAYMLGLSLQDMLGQVRSGFFGKEVQRLQRGRDEVKIWVRYNEKDRSSINNMSEMFITTPTGEKVPFNELATYTIKRGVVSINHLDGKRQINVEADMMNETSSVTEILGYVKDEIIPQILPKYPSVSVLYEGQNREAEKTQKSAAKALPVILFLIIAMITFTFRSFGQTMLLFVLIPFSLIGVAWGHYFHGHAISMLSMMGVVALIGIIVNDGLVLVTKLNTNLKEGMTFNEAVVSAGVSRFRAIFLTTVTTVAGLAPLILEKSFQAQFLVPMAISIAYGISAATILTLVLLPVLLVTLNNFRRLLIYAWEGTKPSPEEVEPAVKELKSENDEYEN